jgi:cation diffusion facilitator CzcD-associated flavoprotein CzcO
MSQSLNSNDSITEQGTSITRSVDVAIVGAGFAGLYLLQKFRQMGLSAQVFEAGDGVGGTWYWNRYPGARCDAESMAYSYSFSPELEQEWEWTERYATQAEILRYINHVADRFELWSDIKLETRVTHVNYSDESHRWSVKTDKGDEVDAQFCIMATGCLSTPQIPNITNLNDFAGPTYYASQWPHEGVDFTDKTVGMSAQVLQRFRRFLLLRSRRNI